MKIGVFMSRTLQFYLAFVVSLTFTAYHYSALWVWRVVAMLAISGFDLANKLQQLQRNDAQL